MIWFRWWRRHYEWMAENVLTTSCVKALSCQSLNSTGSTGTRWCFTGRLGTKPTFHSMIYRRVSLMLSLFSCPHMCCVVVSKVFDLMEHGNGKAHRQQFKIVFRETMGWHDYMKGNVHILGRNKKGFQVWYYQNTGESTERHESWIGCGWQERPSLFAIHYRGVDMSARIEREVRRFHLYRRRELSLSARIGAFYRCLLTRSKVKKVISFCDIIIGIRFSETRQL